MKTKYKNRKMQIVIRKIYCTFQAVNSERFLVQVEYVDLRRNGTECLDHITIAATESISGSYNSYLPVSMIQFSLSMLTLVNSYVV